MRWSTLVSRLSSIRTRLCEDRRGVVMIYVAILLPVLMGTALLAIDASRVFNLQTYLQKGADALAIAGAAELDRRPQAIIRANRAIANLVSNKHRFSNAGAIGITVNTVRFLKSLPASDGSSVDATHETTDPALARFVEVTVAPQSVTSVFPASFVGGNNTVDASARAVAGFGAAVCQFTPMFVCNPFEGTGTSIFDAIADPAIRRRQIVLRKKGGGSAQYAAGNYGFLQPPGGQHGADVIREMLAMANPPACFVQNGVSLRPGFIASADQGLNVRFDMYDGALNGKKSDADFRPAQNVRKGYSYAGNACNAGLDPDDDNEDGIPDNLGLPRDNCFGTNNCPHMGGRMGDGTWDIDTYKTANNLGALPYSNGNLASRYDVYRYEIDNSLVNTPSQGGEVGTPACYSGGGLSNDPDRRILYVAILDCAAHNVQDDNSGNSGPPVPVTVFAQMFVTEPVSQGPDQDIYSELVGVIEPGTVGNKVARDIVQLYR